MAVALEILTCCMKLYILSLGKKKNWLCMTTHEMKYANFLLISSSGSIDEDVVVIEASSTPQVTANEEINVTSTDSEVEIVTVGESYRWDLPLFTLRQLCWTQCLSQGGSCVMKVYEVVFQKFSSADPVCICASKRKTHKNPQLYQSLTIKLVGTWRGGCS